MIDVRSVFAARDAVLTDGVVPEHLRAKLRPTILESWRRSLMCGTAFSIPAREPIEPLGRTGLRLAADPILSRLSERLSDLDTGVLLADQNAVILRRWVADNSILALLDGVNSDVGFGAGEDYCGTNGVGTVIETGNAVQISGPEHLSTELSMFTCVGAPIHHPITRRLEGVITLSCLAGTSHPLLTPLLTSTAQDIEHRMLEQASVRERLLLDAYMVASRQRRGRIAAVGRDLFLAGPQVTELLRDVDQALLWEYVHAAVSGSKDLHSSEFGAFHERFRIAHCEPIESDGEVIGIIVEFEIARRESELKEEVGGRTHASPTAALPGKSAALRQTLSYASRLATTRLSMVIEGEPGVGKLTLARAILDSQQVIPIRIDAGADGPQSVVATLRGALEQRPDAILLQHLDAIPPEAAAPTAAMIEEFTTAAWTPRIIATLTTGQSESPLQPLQRLIDTISVGRVVIPPLRDRREDISGSATLLLGERRGARSLKFSSSALRILMRATWPGNMRQLDNTVRGLVATVAGPEIQPAHLPSHLQAQSTRRHLSSMEELELNAILGALQQYHGNKIAAAASIGISRSTLYRKLRSYHVDPDRQYF